MAALHAENQMPTASREEAARYLSEKLPTMLPVLNSLPFWEGARQAAHYSGPDSLGQPVRAATKAQYETLRPIVGRRVGALGEWVEAPLPADVIAEIRKLMRQNRLLQKGSKHSRKGRAGRPKSP